jgi:hypothetical protein
MSLRDATCIERLDAANYATWSTDVKWALISKGLWNAIDDPERMEDGDDIKALAFIGLTVEKYIKPTVDACDTAREAWDKLEDTYKAQSTALKVKLRRDLVNLKMESCGLDITGYVAKACAIRDQLVAAGMEVSTEEVCMAILTGLPSDYSAMVDSILTTSTEDLQLETLVPKLLIVEQRIQDAKKEVFNPTAASSLQRVGAHLADASENINTNYMICWKCGQRGHKKINCPNKPAAPPGIVPGKTRVHIFHKKPVRVNTVMAL